MVWDKTKILDELRRRHKAGKDLSYNGLARQLQALVSAAAYHFGSYRRAVTVAGIDYADIVRRPRWTKPGIVALIKKAHARGEDLHWSAVTERRDELGKAAFAALQPRLFGRWSAALAAAGLDVRQVSRYRRWGRREIVDELKSRAKNRRPLNSGAIQEEDPGLHAAAVRHFGSYDQALKGASIDPTQVRRRRTWSRGQVLAAIKGHHRARKSLADSAVRRESPALYGAAVRLFGAFTTARDAAGLQHRRKRA
ncbi:MAG TPA: hypothetical protein VMD30_06790 [Tepidisphaeraceae bacterium]|nr:hypothetical protein [Tepidisphaeraceae bacterium]